VKDAMALQDQDMRYMREAIDEAYAGIDQAHGGPFGAVVVKDDVIIGRGHNRVLVDHDPTCHGEMVAIRDACKHIGSHDLSGCTLYTTAAPCPMCKGAILWANVSRVFYGCTLDDTEKLGFRDERFYNNWHQSDTDEYGDELGRAECLKLFSDYAARKHEVY
jgi:guanine deaminase